MKNNKRRHQVSTGPIPIRKDNLNAEQMDAIRMRAYELYEERGREDGHELDDWLRAKDEVLSQALAAVAGA
jgi:hypothetical protein